jgi:hypothetical protein
MALIMPNIDFDRTKNIVKSVMYVIIAVMVSGIMVQAFILKSLNLALLEALTALMLLF